MKIRIEPSADQSKEKHPYYSIQVELPHDDLHLSEFVSLLRAAALAWGYDEGKVREAIQWEEGG